MRTAALLASLLVCLACSDEKKSEAKIDRPSTADSPAHPVKPKLGRGHPPQTFVDADTTGQILASNGKTIFWVERRAEGHFVVGGHKAGGDRFDVAGPVAPIRSLVADDTHVFFAASPLAGTKVEDKARGIFQVALTDSGKLVKLDSGQGQLAVSPTHLYVLDRGTTTKPGRITQIDRTTGKSSLVFQGKKNFGRADMLVTAPGLLWLGDRRETRDGVKLRLGTLRLTATGEDPRVVADDIVSPGPHLREHGGFAYFTARDQESERRRLYRVSLDPKASGKPEALLDKAWEVARFAVDDSGVYILGQQKGWKVVRFAHGSSEPEVLSSPLTKAISPLFLGARYAYWGTSGTIHRVPKTLSKPKQDKSKP